MSEGTTAVIVPKGNELEVSAATPLEMLDCQHALLAWIKRKIELVMQEAAELKAAFEHAVKSKWKSDTLKRHAALAWKRVSFYEKIQAALQAGYYIVPPFPVSVFAIRTDAKKPKRLWSISVWNDNDRREQQAKALPIGEGEYKNPEPLQVQESAGKADPQYPDKESIATWAEDFEQVEFPLSMAKPHIMDATTRAMALQVFDDIGILPQESRDKDPMIIGRIIDPNTAPKWNPKVVCFVIAWHLDTRTL